MADEADILRATFIIERSHSLSKILARLIKLRKASFFIKMAMQKFLETPEGVSLYKDITGEDWETVVANSPEQKIEQKTAEPEEKKPIRAASPLAKSLIK